jgi:hypothetical protein
MPAGNRRREYELGLWLKRSPIFSGYTKLLLHRSIGEAKQNGLVSGLMCHPVPARHDEDVARRRSNASKQLCTQDGGHEFRRSAQYAAAARSSDRVAGRSPEIAEVYG